MALYLVDSSFMEFAMGGEEHGFVAWHSEVGDSQDERLIAFVSTSIEEIRCLCIGAGNDDAGHSHDVKLEPRRIEAQYLLVLRHEHLAALVSALLYPRLLILDVVTRDANFHESSNQVPDMSVSTVTGISIRDNERPIIDLRGGCPLFCRHARTSKELIS